MLGVRRATRRATIRPARREDRAAWVAMRCALWPGSNRRAHGVEVDAMLWDSSRGACLVAVAPGGGLAGFIELSIREYAEGCETDRVGYVEGWFVVPALRGRGVGRGLMAAGEAWARRQGCREFASDTEVQNERSRRAHLASGFSEVERIVCFRKLLQEA